MSISPLIPTKLTNPKTLGDRRRLFSFCISLLIQEINRQAFSCALDTGKTEASGEGHLPGGCHPVGLAEDVLLYADTDKDGEQDDYLTDSEAHRPFGTFWKSLHPLCCWGGDFKDAQGRPKPDGNHYSILHPDGVHK